MIRETSMDDIQKLGKIIKNRWRVIGFFLFIYIILPLFITRGFPGSGKYTPENPAGFLLGIYHGYVALVSLILSIFADIEIYEVHNTGWWYDLGFCLTIGIGVYVGIGIILISIMLFIIFLIYRNR